MMTPAPPPAVDMGDIALEHKGEPPVIDTQPASAIPSARKIYMTFCKESLEQFNQNKGNSIAICCKKLHQIVCFNFLRFQSIKAG